MKRTSFVSAAVIALFLAGLAALSSTSANSIAKRTVTFSKDVAPIFYKNCVQCHRSGDLAPMSLISYKEARPWARSIKEKVVTREMPPWHADPNHGEFANDRRLSKADVDTIAAWVDQGAKEGNPKDLPPAPAFEEGWHIGKPDVVLTMPQEQTIAASGPDEYLYFTIPTDFKEDKWVQAAEIRPGNRRVVHHVIAFIVPKDSLTEALARRRGPRPSVQSYFVTEGTLRRVRMDAPVADDGCAAAERGQAVSNRRDEGGLGALLCGYAPGKDWDVFPTGMAKKIPAGSVIVFQMHYSKTTGKDEKDRSSVGLIFAKQAPERVVQTRAVSNILFKIPAGSANHQVTACNTLDREIQLVNFMPHMHVRGKDMRYEAIYPDGRRQTLLWVPNYDFSWQEVYWLKKPVTLPKGTRLVITAHFDNSNNNKYNPDPGKDVRWGDPTYDEMMIGWLDYVIENQDKPEVAAKTGAK